MTSHRRPTLVVCVLFLGVAILAGAGGSATVAYMSDTAVSNNTIHTAESFNSGTQNQHPCIDQNGNGVCEQSEPTLDDSQLADFDDPTADVIIPAKAKVSPQNSDVSVRANTVTVDGTIDAGQSVSLEATGGDLDASGASIRAKNGGVTMRSAGHLDLDDATVDGDTGAVDIRAQSISAQRASITAKNDAVILSATRNGGGTLDARDASLDGQSGITLGSDGDMNLNGTGLVSKNGGATADLTTSSATLSVQDTQIKDDDKDLVYSPSGVTVAGQPKNPGTVTPDA